MESPYLPDCSPRSDSDVLRYFHLSTPVPRTTDSNITSTRLPCSVVCLADRNNHFLAYLFLSDLKVKSLSTLVINFLTHSCLVDLMPVNDTNCLVRSQQLLKAAHTLKKLFTSQAYQTKSIIQNPPK